MIHVKPGPRGRVFRCLRRLPVSAIAYPFVSAQFRTQNRDALLLELL
jgi:hypothetical protein